MNATGLVRGCWDDLASRAGCPAPAAASVLEEIVQAYREPHRHYHTLVHIASLLTLLDRYGGDAAYRDALRLAILFHDIVYDPTRQDNEQASALLAAERLTSLGFASALTVRVERYIIATRHDQLAGAVADTDLALLLDLDLAILAAASDDYHAYARAVRREYAFVPDHLYRAGRRRVLEGFLARERLYLTDHLHGLWERPARANVAGEVADLH